MINVQEKPLHPGQKRARKLLARYKVRLYLCGRRWGKTTEIRNLALRVLPPTNYRIGLFCPEFKDITETLETVFTVFERINEQAKEAHKKPLFKIDKTHRTIHALNGQDADSAPCFEGWSLANERKKNDGRGRKYDFVIYEETQKIGSDILDHHYNSVAKATLLDRKGTCYFFGTPPNSKSHYFYELICRGAVNNPNMKNQPDLQLPQIQDEDFCSYRAETSDNPLIDPKELKKLERTTPKMIFEQEYRALCLEFAGSMFFDVLKEPEVANRVFAAPKIAFDLNKPTYLSIDFNKHPMAVIVAQSLDFSSQIYIIKEISFDDGQQGNIYDICAKIRAWFAQNGVSFGAKGERYKPLNLSITGDATGNFSQYSSIQNLSPYSVMLEELGLPNDVLKVPRANPRHSETHAQANWLLKNHPNLRIAADECPRLVQDLKRTICTPERGIDKKKYDPHFGDCVRYFFWNFLPHPKLG